MKSKKITLCGLHPKCRFAPVDCVHIICYEFRCDPDSKWWSHNKSNGPGVSFEVVTDPVDGRILQWVNGPEPASTHDLTFLLCGGKRGTEKEWKKSPLYFNLPKGLKLVGDSAYEGQADKVSPLMMDMIQQQICKDEVIARDSIQEAERLQSVVWTFPTWPVHQRQVGKDQAIF